MREDSWWSARPNCAVTGGVLSLYPPIDPTKSTTVTPLRIRFCETDLMGIVHHGNYLLYFEMGRVEWLRNRGVTYADWASKGTHLAVVEANVAFRAPARFDDLLALETTLSELRSASMRFTYRLLRGDQLVAQGFTRLATVDDAQKLVRVSDTMREVLLSGEVAGTMGGTGTAAAGAISKP